MSDASGPRCEKCGGPEYACAGCQKFCAVCECELDDDSEEALCFFCRLDEENDAAEEAAIEAAIEAGEDDATDPF